MESAEADHSTNWSEAMDDLIRRNDLDAAVALLESVFVRHLQTLEDGPSPASAPSDPPVADLRLAAALGDLADLHSARGCSIKADELRARSTLIRQRAEPSSPDADSGTRNSEEVVEKEPTKESAASSINDVEEDDWEAIADCQPSDIRLTKSPVHELREVKVATEMKSEPPKRRGRGSFMYKKNGLYSDEKYDKEDSEGSSVQEDSLDELALENDVKPITTKKFGTRHILVLYDFSPTMRTTDLESYFEKFRNSEVAIRWVNDTCALAVFQSSACAIEAQTSINFPFKVRLMGEDDTLLNQVSNKDLEPPLPRPKTSGRTANRMIAQIMGLKPSPTFGSKELRKQEQARKERIRARQSMRDDAWGPDDP